MRREIRGEDIGVMERFYWLMRQVWWGVVMAVRGLVERWEVAFRKRVGCTAIVESREELVRSDDCVGKVAIWFHCRGVDRYAVRFLGLRGSCNNYLAAAWRNASAAKRYLLSAAEPAAGELGLSARSKEAYLLDP